LSPVTGPHPLVGTELHLEAGTGSEEYQLLAYRHYLLDEQKCLPICDEYGYNGGDPGPAEAVHDFMLECDVEVVEGQGMLLFGLTDGRDHVFAELAVTGGANDDGEVRLRRMATPPTVGAQAPLASAETVAFAPGVGLRPGQRYHIELAFVDRRATLAVEGALPFPPVDLPVVQGRPGVVRPVLLGVKGVKAVVQNFRLFRDIHYTQAGRNAVRGQGVRLHVGQYFVLGDNSPNSEDSRFWPDQGLVPARNLLGKPFLVHLPSRAVAWDALGRNWLYQRPDWCRIRWLR
jgi:signal peptidase I